MKKLFLLAATALMGLTASAQVSVGLQRTATDKVYDAFTSTDAFVTTADGLEVSYYESEEIAEKRTTENSTTLNFHGDTGYQSDFAWSFKCTASGFYGALGHNADEKFPENFCFGFNLTVPAGKQMAVSGITLDLLINTWPAWRVRILDAAGTELYNSGIYEQRGSTSGYQSSGSYAHITADALDMTYAYDPYEGQNADAASNYAESTIEAGFQLLPADFTLEAGTYTVVLDIDHINLTQKPISFDRFLLEGTVKNADITGAITLPTTWNFSDWDNATYKETITKEGLTIAATDDASVAIDGNKKTVDGVEYTKRLKLSGTGKAESRYVSFQVPGKCDVAVVLMSASSSADRVLNVATGEFGNVVGTMEALGASAQKQTYSYATDEPTTIYLYSANSGVNIYAIYVTAPELDPTGISEVAQSQVRSGQVYNLRGQRVSQPRSGQIYVLDGRKFIAR